MSDQLHPKPDRPCRVCGCDDWWANPHGEFVCGWCHPKPESKVE